MNAKTNTRVFSLSEAIVDAHERALAGDDWIEYTVGKTGGSEILANIAFERIEREWEPPQARLETIDVYPEPTIYISDDIDHVEGINRSLLRLWRKYTGETISSFLETIEEWGIEADAQVGAEILSREACEAISAPYGQYSDNYVFYTPDQIDEIEERMIQGLRSLFEDQAGEKHLQRSVDDWKKEIHEVLSYTNLDNLGRELAGRISAYDVEAWSFGDAWGAPDTFRTRSLQNLIRALKEALGANVNLIIEGRSENPDVSLDWKEAPTDPYKETT